MTDAPTPPLPAPIAAYIAANQRLDAEAMLAPFAPDAVVGDERHNHRGTEEIRAWILSATIANKAVPRVTGYSRDGDMHVVEAEVSGAFAGSPVNLSFRIELREGRIARLEIS